MIERGKAVALHKSIVGLYEDWVPLDGRFVHRDLHPNPPPNTDRATGATRGVYSYNPWTLVAYCEQDLKETLKHWNMLVQAIEDRQPAEQIDHPVRCGLFSKDDLRQAGLQEDRFAWKFFQRARKPNFTYLGPGLRLPTPEELAANPFLAVQREVSPKLVPIPILCGDETAKNWSIRAVERVPWGLYLDVFEPGGNCPFEDGCRLVLPYDLGANSYACTADGNAMSGHADLYQIGHNPFMPDHSTQLLAVLIQFYGHVKTGMWKVGPNGVDEQSDAFKEADTDMARWQDNETHIYPRFRLALGPGDRFW